MPWFTLWAVHLNYVFAVPTVKLHSLSAQTCLFVCLFGTLVCHGTLLEKFRMASDKLKSSEDGPSQGGESGTRRLFISDTSEALRWRILSLIKQMLFNVSRSEALRRPSSARWSASTLPWMGLLPSAVLSMWDGIQWIVKLNLGDKISARFLMSSTR